jgi:hypothetical protein
VTLDLPESKPIPDAANLHMLAIPDICTAKRPFEPIIASCLVFWGQAEGAMVILGLYEGSKSRLGTDPIFGMCKISVDRDRLHSFSLFRTRVCLYYHIHNVYTRRVPQLLSK